MKRRQRRAGSRVGAQPRREQRGVLPRGFLAQRSVVTFRSQAGASTGVCGRGEAPSLGLRDECPIRDSGCMRAVDGGTARFVGRIAPRRERTRCKHRCPATPRKRGTPRPSRHGQNGSPSDLSSVKPQLVVLLTRAARASLSGAVGAKVVEMARPVAWSDARFRTVHSAPVAGRPTSS